MTVSGQYYHVLNRGNERQVIFYETENYLYFLRQLGKYLESYGPTLVAYCLMPNHFHLLMRENTEEGIPKCLHALQTSYAKAMNKRFNRSGHLFQDSYQKILIQDDAYLVHLSRYIHLNPVCAGLVSLPEEWPYSSYREYIGVRKGRLPRPEIVLSQFPNMDGYRYFVMDMANNKDLGELALE